LFQSMKDEAQRQGDLVILGENLSDKLKMLDYDAAFLKRYGMEPISRHYFVYATDAVSGNVRQRLLSPCLQHHLSVV
jgi:hypothetical protein